MIGSDIIADQQKEIVNKLEDDFGKLRAENIRLHSELKLMGSKLALDKEFQQSALPTLLNGRLLGKNIAVVEVNSTYFHQDWEERLINNLKKAGANICSVTVVPNDLDLKNLNKKEKIMQQLNWDSAEKEQLFPFLADNLSQEIIGYKTQEYLPLLERMGILKRSGGTLDTPNSIIVIGGGSNGGELDKRIIRQWKRQGLKIVGVEPNNTPVSSMPTYQKLGISTIDNIDTVPGQVSLVWLLQQNREGNYGIKPTAEKLLPSLATN